MTTINKIIQQFPAEYALPFALALALAGAFFAADKLDAFWKRYDKDEVFRKLMNSNYAYKRDCCFDFWFITDEYKPYLQPQFANAEVLLIEEGKVSCLSVKQIERALSEARKDCEKFKRLIIEARDYKQNIWLELEERLNETKYIICV